MSKEKKQKLKEYQKNYRKAKESQFSYQQKLFIYINLIVYTMIYLCTDNICVFQTDISKP